MEAESRNCVEALDRPVAPPLVGGAQERAGETDRASIPDVAPLLVGGAAPVPTGTNHSRYQTWSKNRSVRLAGFDYREHQPYHVIVCAREGTSPFVTAPIARMVCDTLFKFFYDANAFLGAFCLMSDHLHFLISPDRSGQSLGQLVGRFKGITTNRCWKLGRSGRIWQPRFYDHIIRKSERIVDVAKYIYENSDHAGLPVDYPFRFVDPAIV